MGNRAVVTTKSECGFSEDALGVYLHWNGGRDSITAFLKYCELQGFKSPEIDSTSWSHFQRVVLNFNDGLSTVKIDACKNLDCDNYDNGVYLIENWKIVGRKYFGGKEQDEYPLKDMLLAIDEKQPVALQIREKILLAMDDSAKIFMEIGGSAENGYQVVRILINKTGRHYSTIYSNADYSACVEWMNATAAKSGFAYDQNAKMWSKSA